MSIVPVHLFITEATYVAADGFVLMLLFSGMDTFLEIDRFPLLRRIFACSCARISLLESLNLRLSSLFAKIGTTVAQSPDYFILTNLYWQPVSHEVHTCR